MSAIKIRKIGNSLGVILPKEIQESLQVKEGDLLEFTNVDNKKVLLESYLPHNSKWKFNGKASLDKEWSDADLEDENDYAPVW
ncbi:MAG: hypothetical protein A2504_16460 [Bdellovibrionales bacterium RIFOXYD12_FULL_39_22]|nr:MAG: hypothetical protein A2385_10115 [Bdellovibrionales bacterium RIFOXYB1_FULL_39_21]OFZ45452.1 MAG: hypothetical protein A2404_01355 [Bdellovibrionales bacterium RIFOXYC1_FULL_39_130]OFZ71281.1 MAG: hypothetical protein A2451_06975 [Bdellovibrionales bacterium RIFOXYC2_FULL_39_8]OFZ74657.1 MAG: hypothetical protein A2560_09685 [Bdellovibrionales bacterium RIFOXYD1_FULL_39_84]OFZ92966.1 MAG: hypothetical protein A2504_16460 [Bdellovibrionales bacterium RIFOXYD12_FULL_39_22]